MVLKNMKNIPRLLFLIILAFSFSCEKQGLIAYCPDCTEDEPVTTILEASLDNVNYSAAIIKIYEGNLEDNILLYTIQVASTNFSYEVMINKKYTITATYQIANDVYIAVDSATPRVKYTKDQCDTPCYFVYDKTCNLRLKYTK
jgi:hypothetical protein